MIINNIPIEAYHSSAPRWLSKTSLRDYLKMGPAWWRLAYLDKAIRKPRPDGAAQGSALDCYLTEGAAEFERRYVIKPDGIAFNTKEGKAWRDKHAEGKECLSHEDGMILADAIDAVMSCCAWKDIEKAMPQQTIRRHSESLGLGLQSRPDWLRNDGRVLFDLKKTRDLDRFGGQAFDLGYHLQAAIAGWCLAGDGIALEHAFLVSVEWERGARCRVYEIPHDMLAHGNEMMRDTASDIARRIKENDWRDKHVEPEMLPLPTWAQRKMEAAP